ncbi:MAG: haloacid dehalogenase-like hydrolase [Lachnospiraceae bacterium]
MKAPTVNARRIVVELREGMHMSKNCKKRLLACTASDFEKMDREDLIHAIKASEGRTVLSEIISYIEPTPIDITNAEIVRSYGADLMLLNKLDLNNIHIGGLPDTNEPIRLQKKLCGRPVGINLEPVGDNSVELMEGKISCPRGRQAIEENFKECQKLGFDFICITGNPGMGVSNQAISDSLSIARKYFDGMIIAGKMHGAGVSENVVDEDAILSFIEHGADCILVPAPGTVPGVDIDDIKSATKLVHKHNKLIMSAIGTSQEGSEIETIRDFAMMSKRCGVDIQHIGDAGYPGVCPYENIYTISMVIRGLRHTVRMSAISNER